MITVHSQTVSALHIPSKQDALYAEAWKDVGLEQEDGAMQGETDLKQECEVESDVSVAFHDAVFVFTKCLHREADQGQGIHEALSDEETNIVFELIRECVLQQRVSQVTLAVF